MDASWAWNWVKQLANYRNGWYDLRPLHKQGVGIRDEESLKKRHQIEQDKIIIIFFDEDVKGIQILHNDAIIVFMMVAKYILKN